MSKKIPTLSVSTWSVHRALGDPGIYGPADSQPRGSAPRMAAAVSLLELPARLAAFGVHHLEICHFHLPAVDADYTSQLKGALDAAGVTLWSILVDAGDVTDPEHGARDQAWIARWLPIASALGAKNVRVIAGKGANTTQNLARSKAALMELAEQATTAGMRLTTENWFALLSTPRDMLWLLDELQGKVGLNLDFGNWSGPKKYADLAQIAPRAQSTHAKGHFNGPYVIDAVDYVRCLDLTREAGFRGVHTLVYDDGAGPDEWRGLQIERELVLTHG